MSHSQRCLNSEGDVNCLIFPKPSFLAFSIKLTVTLTNCFLLTTLLEAFYNGPIRAIYQH